MINSIRPPVGESSFIVIRRIWNFIGDIAAFFLDMIRKCKIFDTLFLVAFPYCFTFKPSGRWKT